MHQRCLRRTPLRLTLAWAALALLAPLAHAQGGTYRFSPVNQYGIELTASYWNPILDYVSNKSGVKLQLKIGRTSADTTAYVLANEVEFIFSNHLFSPERDHLGWKVFGRRATTPIRSQIAVLDDSPITQLAQLANESVGFPGPEATVAYKFAYAQLLDKKIPVQVVFGGNMDGAFGQLVGGKEVHGAVGLGRAPHGKGSRTGRQPRWLYSRFAARAGIRRADSAPPGAAGPGAALL